MTVYNYKYIENRKWEDTASEISELEAQSWELLSVVHNGAGTGLKQFQAWMRRAKISNPRPIPPSARLTPPTEN